MASILDKFKARFKRGPMAVRLVYVNILVWAYYVLIANLFPRFKDMLDALVAMPLDWPGLLRHPWSPFTYMFAHTRIDHLLLNCLWLYYFGRLFHTWFTDRQALEVYVGGGLAGALFFLIGYRLFPSFSLNAPTLTLTGASAACLSLLAAVVVSHPRHEAQVLSFGPYRLVWIGLVMALIVVFGLGGPNWGGNLAHLGGLCFGALAGWVLGNGSKPRKSTGRKYHRPSYEQADVDQAYRDQRKAEEERCDAILDKIKRSGFDSLSEEERVILYNMGKQHGNRQA